MSKYCVKGEQCQIFLRTIKSVVKKVTLQGLNFTCIIPEGDVFQFLNMCLSAVECKRRPNEKLNLDNSLLCFQPEANILRKQGPMLVAWEKLLSVICTHDSRRRSHIKCAKRRICSKVLWFLWVMIHTTSV